MKTILLCSVVAVAGHAAAGITLLKTEVSTDGQVWSDDLTVRPGAKVQVRITTSFIGSEHVYGFQGINLQPTIENWGEGDRVESYVRDGSRLTGAYARDKPRPGEFAFGRMYTFAVPTLTGGVNTPLAEHVQTVNGSRYLRIAQSRTTRWIGEGPTTGTAAFNNFNGAGGIPFHQVGQGSPYSVPPNYSTQNVVLFKFMISLDADQTNRSLVAFVPPASCSRTDGVRNGTWYLTSNLSDSIGAYLHAPVESLHSLIRVIGPVPAPGTLPLLALSAAAFTRRRRA